MVIDCKDEGIDLNFNGINILIDREALKELNEVYEDYYEEIDGYDVSTKEELIKCKDLVAIINKYVDRNQMGKIVGGEYVIDNVNARNDAIDMFAEILNYLMEKETQENDKSK